MAKGILIEDVRSVKFNDKTGLYRVKINAGGKRRWLHVPPKILDKGMELVGSARSRKPDKSNVVPFRRH